jgi:MFS family permease
MMKDLAMDDGLKGKAAGIFFIGYMLLQIPGGYFASRWSARKVISLCLIAWGVCAVGCGLARSYGEFAVLRFLLGVAESAVFPATVVLLAHWFPRAERARANAYWSLCQPLAVAGSAPFTGWLLGQYGWRTMLMLEGALPFIWLPLWWFLISDHPRNAKWISSEEKEFLESTLQREAAESEPPGKSSWWTSLRHPAVWMLVVIYFLHCSAAYGCMTFFTDGLKGKGLNATQYGLLFAVPYAVAAVMMVLNSRHSDKTRERRGHVAVVYALSGVCLILSVVFRQDYWLSYALLCLAIPGPFAAMGPLWAIPGEIFPRSSFGLVAGIVNAFGNLGGYAGPFIVGWLTKKYQNTEFAFNCLGTGLLVAAALVYLLPGTKLVKQPQT